MAEFDERFLTNREKRLTPKKHSLRSQRVLGLPKGARKLSRKQLDTRLAKRVARAKK